MDAIRARLDEIQDILLRGQGNFDHLIAEVESLSAKIYDPDEMYVIQESTQFIRERLARQEQQRIYCATQPAGTPTFLNEAGLGVVFAPGYAEPFKKKPRKRLKAEEKRKLREQRKKLAETPDDVPLFMTPRGRKWAKNGFVWKQKGVDKEGYRERRRWYSERLGCFIVIMENQKTKKCKAKLQNAYTDNSDFKCSLYMNTWTAAKAYSLEAEQRAMEMLKDRVTESQYTRYFCTGFLVEVSKKTGLIYIFRRLRPILVYRLYEVQGAIDKYTAYKWVAALCMHTQGYYSGSWAGTLTPTDDLVAQLLLMRADEKLLWRKSNKHSRRAACADV